MNIKESIQNWVNETCKEAMVKIRYSDKTVTICTSYPGQFIGKNGCLYNKYAKDIEAQGYKVKFFDIDEHFKPGNNWDDIMEERMKAFFETEYN